jgi:hypothetical protein
MWSTNNEQHMQMRMWGGVKRRIVDFEVLQLIEIPSDYSALGEKSKPRKAEIEE